MRKQTLRLIELHEKKIKLIEAEIAEIESRAYVDEAWVESALAAKRAEIDEASGFVVELQKWLKGD